MRRTVAALCMIGAASAAAAQPAPIDPHAPELDALARSALPRARVSPLHGRISPLKGAASATAGRAEAIRDMAQELRASGLTVVSTEAGLRVSIPENVLFDFDRSDLRPDAAPRLEALRTALGQVPDLPVRIEGHTDSKGAEAYNLRLSEARARAVRDWFVGRQVPAARIQAVGLGKARPVASNTTPDGRDDPAGRQKNRRVEVVIGA